MRLSISGMRGDDTKDLLLDYGQSYAQEMPAYIFVTITGVGCPVK